MTFSGTLSKICNRIEKNPTFPDNDQSQFIINYWTNYNSTAYVEMIQPALTKS